MATSNGTLIQPSRQVVGSHTEAAPPQLPVGRTSSGSRSLAAEFAGGPDPSEPDDGSGKRCTSPPPVQLPRRGADDDALLALDKLDRLEKVRDGRSRLRKVSLGAAWPFRRASARKAQQQDCGDEGDDDAGEPLRALGEVKLAITSLPNYPVMAARGAASRARTFVGGAFAGESAADRGKTSSPDASHSDLNSESVGPQRRRTFLFGSSAARATQRRGSTSGPEEGSSHTSGVLRQSTSTSLQQGPAEEHQEQQPIAPVQSVSEEPELDAVQEEHVDAHTVGQAITTRSSEAQDGGSSVAPSAHGRGASDLLSAPKRPRLTLQGPSEEGGRAEVISSGPASQLASRQVSEAEDTRDSEGLRPPQGVGASVRGGSTGASSMTGGDGGGGGTASSIASILDGPLHEDPETHEDVSASAVGSHLSDQSDSDDASADGSSVGEEEDEEDLETQAASLNLEHVQDMSKKEMRRAVREARRLARRQGTIDAAADANARHSRRNSVVDRVSRGLHYASSTSRNRRAYERYSPNPNAKLNGAKTAASPTGSIGRPSPHASASLLDLVGGRPLAKGEGGVDSGVVRAEDGTMSPPYRTATGISVASSAKGSVDGGSSFRSRYLHAPKLLGLRRRFGGRGNAEDDVDEAGEDATTPTAEDPEQELERVLGKLMAEQAPEEVKEKYEFDILYENQRGMLIFGIPKFSSQALLQWDPSPWTNGLTGHNSPYNVANAQLPDPSWEWVYPEWLVDMSGDTDEAGWQYSGNFARVWMPHFRRPPPIMPRSGPLGAEQFNERLQKADSAVRTPREDQGLEALKRSAQARSPKWTGLPGPGSFVRRRRWIRLRRRQAISSKPSAPGTKPAPRASTPARSLASQEWGKIAAPPANVRSSTTSRDEVGKTKGDERMYDAASMHESDDSEEEYDEGMSDSSELSEEISNAGARDMAPADANSSAFLPRRLPGHLMSGADPVEAHLDRDQRRRRRHAREFTGTIRELKSLLPAIMTRHGRHMHFSHASADEKARLWLTEIDARNPFISWRYIKKRLEQDDLAFASATLRARERRFQRRIARQAAGQATVVEGKHPQLPAEFVSEAASNTGLSGPNGTSSTGAKFEGAGTTRSGIGSTPTPSELRDMVGSPPPPPASQIKSLTRDALVEINYRRVVRVMKACKVDRQKLHLWRTWLGVEPINHAAEPARNEDLIDLGLSFSPAMQSDGIAKQRAILRSQAMSRWRSSATMAEPLDVWDVLERRLDHILMLFEYQTSRASLLRLLLELHARSHGEHRFPNTRWKLDAGDGRTVQPNAPSVLSPAKTGGGGPNGATHVQAHRHDDDKEDDYDGTNAALDDLPEEWQKAALPRLEFFSDLIACARDLVGRSGTTSPHAEELGDTSDAGSPHMSVVGLDKVDAAEISRPPSRAKSPPATVASSGGSDARRGSIAFRGSQHHSKPHRTTSQAGGEADRAFLRELLTATETARRKAPTTGGYINSPHLDALANTASGAKGKSRTPSPLLPTLELPAAGLSVSDMDSGSRTQPARAQSGPDSSAAPASALVKPTPQRPRPG